MEAGEHGLKLHPVARRRRFPLRYGVEVPARPSLGRPQLLSQLPRLPLAGLAGLPQGALQLANALLQLPVASLRRRQALLQLASPLLLLEQRRLHRGAEQLGDGERESGRR